MSSRPMIAVRVSILAAMTVLTLVGCGTATPATVASSTASAQAASAQPTGVAANAAVAASTTCAAEQSYTPSSVSGTTVAKIKKRGRLVAGISADTYLFGYRNPITGTLEGFDIDLVKAISQAIFGDTNHIEYRSITADQRITLLNKGTIDIVVRTMTMNCERWKQINFSAAYFVAGQKVLVSKDSSVTGIAGLKGKRVCAPKGSTSVTNAASYGVIMVTAALHTDCLALFQEGSVDAITGDDAILAGLAAQDPYAKVVGATFSREPYGIGIAKANVDFVRYVNHVLDSYRQDGSWKASYSTWIGTRLGAVPSAPTPVYGR